VELLRFNMCNLSAVRHLEFDRKWIFTIRASGDPSCTSVNFNTIGQCAAELMMI